MGGRDDPDHDRAEGERDEAGPGDGHGLSGIPLDTLVALLASRSGVHPVVYVHTRTDAQLAADASAWIQSWAFPASTLMGGTKGSGRPGPGRSRPPASRRKWDWVKPRRGVRWQGQQVETRQNWMDFDEWDRPETVGQLKAAMLGAFAKPEAKRFEAGEVVHPSYRKRR